MNDILTDAIFRGFAVFCRIGTCLMLMPGFSSTRVPVTVRLFIALTVSVALLPRLDAPIGAALTGQADGFHYGLLLSECAIGGLIGLTGRYFFMGLEAGGVLMANAIGMANAFTMEIAEEDTVPAIASLITLAASMLFFATNQHLEVLKALVQSYDVMPPVAGFSPRPALVHIVDALSGAFLLALRASAPFFVFGIVINVISGLLNRLVPNLPVFFIFTPLVVVAGLALAYFTVGHALHLFIAGFADWLRG
jgi:flagellar biosynthetic protein FliR